MAASQENTPASKDPAPPRCSETAHPGTPLPTASSATPAKAPQPHSPPVFGQPAFSWAASLEYRAWAENWKKQGDAPAGGDVPDEGKDAAKQRGPAPSGEEKPAARRYRDPKPEVLYSDDESI